MPSKLRLGQVRVLSGGEQDWGPGECLEFCCVASSLGRPRIAALRFAWLRAARDTEVGSASSGMNVLVVIGVGETELRGVMGSHAYSHPSVIAGHRIV